MFLFINPFLFNTITAGGGGTSTTNMTQYITNGLIGYWDTSLNTSYPGSGTTLTDLTTSAYNLSITSLGAYNASPPSITWTSSEYAIKTGISPAISLTSMTMEMLIQCSSLTNTPNLMSLYNGTTGINMNISSTGQLGLGATLITATPCTSNTWMHLAISYTSTTAVTMYVNGIAYPLTSTAASIPSGITQIILGNNYGTYTTGPVGNISMARLYNVALTQQQIVQNYVSAVYNLTGLMYDPYYSQVSLLVHGDNTFTDYSIYSNAPTTYGTANDLVPSSTVYKYGSGSLYYNGSYYTLYPPSPGLAFGANDWTIEFWAYGGIATQSSSAVILANWTTTTWTTGNWVIGITPTTNTIGFQHYQNQNWTAAGTISASAWTHFAFCRNGSNLYAAASGTVTKTTNYFTFNTDNDGTCPLLVAWDYNGSNFNGYIDDLRITNGTARYTDNFTPPTTALPNLAHTTPSVDPYFGNVVLLLHGDGDFTDSSQYLTTLTSGSTAPTNSSSVYKYGSGSIAFSAAVNNNLYTANSSLYAFRTNNFTIEFWIYLNNTTSGSIISNYVNATFAANNWSIAVNTTLQFTCYNINGNATANITTAITTGVFHHVALVRNGTTFTLYLDGVSSGTSVTSSAILDGIGTTNAIYLGASGQTSLASFSGYLDDVRVTNGIARYTQNFTVPWTAFPNYGQITIPTDPYFGSVVLALRGDGSFTDSSIYNNQMTLYGTPAISSTATKFGPASLSFNGSSFLSTPGSPALVFGTQNFTIEFWFNATSTSTQNTFMGNYTPNAATIPTWGWNLYNAAGVAQVSLYIYSATVFTGTNTFTTGTWNHYALVRNGSLITGYMNGLVDGTYTLATALDPGVAAGYINVGGSGYNTTTTTALFTGYIDDLRVTIGVARYTAAFTPTTVVNPNSLATSVVTTDASIGASPNTDPYYGYTVLLLHGDDTSFTDSSAYNVTMTATATPTTTTTYKFGTGAMAFPGTASTNIWLNTPSSVAYAISTNNFTIEFWIYLTSLGSTLAGVIGNVNGTFTAATNWAISQSATGVLNFMAASAVTPSMSTAALSINTWYHIAVVRNSTTFYMFVNGVQVATYTSSAAVTAATANTIYVGGYSQSTATAVARSIAGYLDDVRITNGIARYTANFTPPTAPFPNSGPYEYPPLGMTTATKAITGWYYGASPTNSYTASASTSNLNFFPYLIFDRTSAMASNNVDISSSWLGSTITYSSTSLTTWNTTCNISTYLSTLDGAPVYREYLQLQLSVPVPLTSYSLTGYRNSGQNPASWTIAGSMDGTNFTTVTTNTSSSWPTNYYVYPPVAIPTASWTGTGPSFTYTVAGTSYGSGTYICSSSNVTLTNYDARKLFDGIYPVNGQSFYYTTTTASLTTAQYVQLQLPQSIVLAQYFMSPLNLTGFTYPTPTAWTVQGSANGTAWTALNAQTGIASPLPLTGATYTVTGNTTAYSYYRMSFTAPLTGNFYVKQWLLYGPTPYSSATLTPTLPTFTVNSPNSYLYYRFIVNSLVGSTNGIGASGIAALSELRLSSAYPIQEWPPAGLATGTLIAGTQYLLPVYTSSLTGQPYGNGVYVTSAATSWSGGGTLIPYNAFDKGTSYWQNDGYTSVAGYYTSGTGYYTGTASTIINEITVLGDWLQIKLPNTIVLMSYSIQARNDASYTQSPSTWYIVGSNDGTTWNQVDYQTSISSWTTGTVFYFGIYGNTSPYSYYRIAIPNALSATNGFVAIAEWRLFGYPAPLALTAAAGFPLDGVSAAGILSANGLYACKRLLSSYTGPVLQLRSTAGGANQNFYADAYGNLTTGSNGSGTTFASWIGSATAYVVTWYDQSGKSNNATQATTGSQPAYNRTSMLVDFSSPTNAYLQIASPGIMPVGDSTYTCVLKHGTTLGGTIPFFGAGTNLLNQACVFGFDVIQTRYYTSWYTDDCVTPVGTAVAGNVVTYRYISSGGALASKQIFINGAQSTITQSSGVSGVARLSSASINYIGVFNAVYLNSQLYYLSLFSTNITDADRAIVELQ